MGFLEWLYSTYKPNPTVDPWGTLQIIVVLLCIGFVVASTLLLKDKSDMTKYIVLASLAIVMIIFGITRRVIGFINPTGHEMTFNRVLKILLPRPGCAISCWLVLIALIIRKKYFYNFASIVGILCATIFFAYPSVGFTNKYILFENLYSIVTHSIFLVICICFITYKFVDFDYKSIWKEGICFGAMLLYTFLEIYVLKIDPDPFYFLKDNEVQEVVGMGYGLYLPLYLLFMIVYIGSYYVIPKIKELKKK